MGVCIESEKEAIKTCDNEGKQTPTARLLLSVMATLAQFEIEQKKERQMEGIARKKATGFYKLNAGRSKESATDFINKDKNQRILKMLKKGAEETNNIWTLIRFVRRYDNIQARLNYNEKVGLTREEQRQKLYTQEKLAVPYVRHLYENR